jgi:hypothetical protein
LYVYKGHDRAVVQLSAHSSTDNSKDKDEIQRYLDCRYVAAPESCWRISGFNMHGQQPSVQQLQIHLQDQQTVRFSADESAADVASRGAPHTTLTAFLMLTQQILSGMAANQRVKFFTIDFQNILCGLESNGNSVKDAGVAVTSSAECASFIRPKVTDFHMIITSNNC